MKCEELMKTNVVLAREDESVQTAAQLMRSANVGFLPVADASGVIVGAVTDRDIALRVVADALPADRTPVRQAMTRGVVTCLPTDDVTLARDRMAQNVVSRVVVVEADGHLRGVISGSDIAESLGPTEAAVIEQAFHREVRPS